MVKPAVAPEGKPLRIWFLSVDRKTDILALTAFIIATTSGAYQLYEALRGPDVTFAPPSTIYFFRDTALNGRSLVELAAPMSYTNTAKAEFTGLLNRETATVTVGGLRSSQVWASTGKMFFDGQKAAPTYEGEAGPTPVSGGSAITHVSFFSAPPPACAAHTDCLNTNAIDDAAFSKAIMSAPSVRVDFSAEINGRPAQIRTCTVVLTNDLIRHWFDFGDFAASCAAD